ncbi:MAG: amino acid aminotransferase [Caulobacter sp.]|nr:amino acid aminotransferase [Caulobacter sp.]
MVHLVGAGADSRSLSVEPRLRAPPSAYERLSPQPPDALLPLIKAFCEDPRPEKIDLGVGVYRDEAGETPVFAAVKAAEALLVETQQTKAYLGPEGDTGFLDLMSPVIFGEGAAGADVISVQTPGGTGALRLAAELANAARPGARILVGSPSWPIHRQIFAAAGLEVAGFRHFDPPSQTLAFDDMLSALERAERGDLVLLHGCCHNPSGADLSSAQWAMVTGIIADRGVVPLIDLAYQGLGRGLDADARGVRAVFDTVDEALVAYSCDKNFGLYRERTGALFVRSRRRSDVVRSNILSIARCLWSMPPDHGAAVVRLILQSPELRASWEDELQAMRRRLGEIRAALSQADSGLAPLSDFDGLFAILPLSGDQVEAMRRDGAVYMAASGRINLAGLTPGLIRPFVEALCAVTTVRTA